MIQQWHRFWHSLRAGQRVLLGSLTTLLVLATFFIVSYETVYYTESTEFCSTCHSVMEPQIDTHQISAHANVDCGTCHVGPGLGYKAYYKITAVRYLWTLPLGIYERPLPPAHETLRSPDEVCEQCHTPETFHQADVITDYTYAPDEENTLTRSILAFKIGNGIERIEGRGMGSHWHVANPVTFIATDELRQTIPWVQVEKDGKVVTYIDSEADPALWTNSSETYGELGEMDCLDCHSRQGHIVPKPAQAIDLAMANGQIAADLPFVKAEAVTLLNERYESATAGMTAIENALSTFYQQEYPQIWADRATEVDQATTTLQTIFSQTQFPHMNVYWDTYPNDIGHDDFPGCMRCHDGNHLNAQGEAIRAECNLCHSIPQTVGPDANLPVISLAAGEIPESHLSSLWLAEHRYRFDATCDDCHTIADPGGSSDSSFCSNSGCHAREWPYLNISAPTVLALSIPTEPADAPKLPRVPHPVLAGMGCQNCHGLEEVLSYPEDHSEYTERECIDCHRLARTVRADFTATPPPPPPATPTSVAIPWITHPRFGFENCVACHAPSSDIAPAPLTHESYANDRCQDCHSLSAEAASIPTWTPTATWTPLPPTPAATATATMEPTATTAPTATPLPATPEVVEPTTEPAQEDTSNETPTEIATAASTSVDTQQYSPITHPIVGNEDCAACHAVDSPIDPAPQDHLGFTDAMCQSCHLPQ